MAETEIQTPTQDQAVTSSDSDLFDSATQSYMDDQVNEPVEDKAPVAASDKATESEEKPAVSADSVTPKPDQGKIPPEPSVPTPEFEISPNLKIRAGDKITGETLQEIQKGYMRTADYTRKTQELKPIREEALGIVAARDQILKEPQSLRQFLNDELIFSAYHPHELLNASLEKNGINPEAWNTFLDQYEGGEIEVKKEWRADPYAKKFDELGRELKPLKEFVTNFTKSRDKWQKDQAETKAKNELNTEIDSAMKKHTGVSRKEILLEIVTDQTGRTVEQIAASLKADKDKSLSEYQKSLGDNLKKTKSAKPEGSTVPLMRKELKNFDDASEAALADMAAGHFT
jgi:hypothetical protein